MKITFRRVGFLGWRRLWCAVAHRPFYVLDAHASWYCDACIKNEMASLRRKHNVIDQPGESHA